MRSIRTISVCPSLLTLLLFGLSPNSYATGGRGVGNGGMGVYCPRSTGVTATVEMTDLFEGRSLRIQGNALLAFPDPNSMTVDQFVIYALDRLRSAGFNALADAVANGRAQLHREDLIPTRRQPRAVLNRTPDPSSLVSPPLGCQEVQVINFVENQSNPTIFSSRMLINQRFYRLMNPLNRAAGDLHEILYFIARRHLAPDTMPDSTAVKPLVAQLLANNGTDEEIRRLVAIISPESLTEVLPTPTSPSLRSSLQSPLTASPGSPLVVPNTLNNTFTLDSIGASAYLVFPRGLPFPANSQFLYFTRSISNDQGQSLTVECNIKARRSSDVARSIEVGGRLEVTRAQQVGFDGAEMTDHRADIRLWTANSAEIESLTCTVARHSAAQSEHLYYPMTIECAQQLLQGTIQIEQSRPAIIR